ncbi:MAG: potassium channel family protein [Desulfobulbaceae bacterium]|nr:potassium channel family protein [Desulfobulbaceae bacterium]
MHKSITVIILFALLLLVGTFGYMYSEGIDFWNSMYLTVITITTVGYGDMVPKHASGKILTAV